VTHQGHTRGTEPTALCRSYRFGHVVVDVFPELVVIAVPYAASHDDFCDASMFVERYTHSASATFIEDDEHQLELHLYPNVENLVSGRPCQLPPVDPRIGHWDEPSRRPSDAGVVVLPGDKPMFPTIQSIVGRMGPVEWYLQDVALRCGAAVATLVHSLPVH